MKKRIAFMAAAGIGLCFAETVFVGDGEVRSVNVAQDATLTDTLVVSDGGLVTKTGAGTWTVPLAQIPQGMPVSFGVREGSLTILPDDPAQAVSVPQPTDVLNKAALWLDASAAGKLLTTESDDATNVEAWLDVRETGNESDGYRYPRAVANLRPAGKYPTFVEKEGKPSVYFGGYQSGETMDWVKTNGSRLVLTNIRHLFIMHGVWETYGFLVSVTDHDYNASGTSRFHIADTTVGSPNFQLYRTMYIDAETPYTGRVFQNGVRVDPCETYPLKNQFQLQEVDCHAVPGIASNFFNDRNYYSPNPQFSSDGGNRIGGDYLAEVVVFTNSLTEVERLSVETWMMRKWLGRTSPACNVATAKRTSVKASGADVARMLSAVKGDGTLVKTGSDAVEIKCAAGSAEVAAFAVDEGIAKIGPRYPIALNSGDRYVVTETGNDLPAYTRVADAAAGTAVKDGDGTAHIAFLNEGVSNVVVNAGTLVVSGEKQSHVMMPGSIAEAEVPYGEFEDWTGDYIQVMNDQSYSGWNLVGLHDAENNYRDVVIFTSGNGTGTGWLGAASGYGAPLPAPDGSRIMMLKGNSSAWTQVTIPLEGEYEISFNGSARTQYGGLPVDLMIGSDENSLMPIASIISQVGWRKYSYRTPWLQPGTYQLWFRNKAQNLDRTLALDNLRLSYDPKNTVRKMPVPNGSFENTVAGFNTSTPVSGDTATCWHFIAGEAKTTATPPIFVSTSSMTKYFDNSYNRFGFNQLAFSAIGSVAENTFTVTKSGTWKLQFIGAVMRSDYNCAWASVISGEIVRGEETISLGGAVVGTAHMRDVTLPNAVTLTEGETVTLRLRGDWTYNASSSKSCIAVVDDLMFADASQLSDNNANLISNGGFEDNSNWQFTNFPKAASYVNGSAMWPYLDYQKYYGYDVYEGKCHATIVQNDITWCTFNTPEAGLYRLTFYAHSRADDPNGSGNNPVTSFWVDPDYPSCTNQIGYALVNSTNFVKCSYAFMLPKKNGLIFGLQGNYSHIDGVAELKGGDHTTVLDGVSICREPDVMPDLPENCTISVAPSAKLRLDYDGVIEVVSCRLGTANRTGEITAEKYPEFISGPGRLFVKPRNFVFIIR